MRFTESIVEDATLDWLKEIGYSIGHGPEIAPGKPAAEREAFSDAVLSKRVRLALRKLKFISQRRPPRNHLRRRRHPVRRTSPHFSSSVPPARR